MLVQKLRVKRGWSQEQLAELSGVSVRTIQRIERGRTASPETLKALAAVLEVDFSQLQETDMTDAARSDATSEEALAFTRVRKLKEFYIHAIQFAIWMPILIGINLLTSPNVLWFQWPLLGWGAGVALHGIAVWNRLSFLDGTWERREVEKILGRRL